eukprot:3080910-Prorocentrum_lima.AAC.1
MTSSLVGSEMCIRDRALGIRDHNCPLVVGLDLLRRVPGQLLGVECPVPVSYTHLTLPTICSV